MVNQFRGRRHRVFPSQLSAGTERALSQGSHPGHQTPAIHQPRARRPGSARRSAGPCLNPARALGQTQAPSAEFWLPLQHPP